MLRHELEAIKMKFSDRQTDRQTDRRKEKMGCSTSGLRMEYNNLNENQKNNSQYSHHRYYDLLQSKFNDINLIQIVKFNTWSRLVENTQIQLWWLSG